MPEGIDAAADAFRNEIAPGSERPRDDGGRFASARPEPLFEPRALEGDDKGDTRDAGEDPRLAAIERRIADGRSEEGDADELARISNESAKSRNASGDDKHRGTDAEQTGSGDEKPDGEHAQGADKGDGAEGTADEDAEAARWALTHDGKPVDKIEIDIGGETRQVSLKDVIRGYADGEAVVERERKFGEQAKQWEQASANIAQEIGQARQTYQQRLEYVGRLMAGLYPKEPNWEAEYAADPKGAHDKERVFRLVRGQMESLAQEMQREQTETRAQIEHQQQAAAQHEAAYADWGKKEFQRRTGITDTATLNNEFSAMRKAGLEVYGFTEHELGTVYDPRMLHVLRDASEYRRMAANKPRPVIPDKGRTLAPGSARPIGSAARRGIDDALKNQARSGSIDSTAAVFERLIR